MGLGVEGGLLVTHVLGGDVAGLVGVHAGIVKLEVVIVGVGPELDRVSSSLEKYLGKMVTCLSASAISFHRWTPSVLTAPFGTSSPRSARMIGRAVCM
jgi:hypothetical protein